MRREPRWERGWSYREYRKMLLLWHKVAGPHIGDANIGTLLLFNLSGRAQQVLMRRDEAALEDFWGCVDDLDKEYQWTPTAEGYSYDHHYNAHRRDPRSTSINDYITDHETRYNRLLHSLLGGMQRLCSHLLPRSAPLQGCTHCTPSSM